MNSKYNRLVSDTGIFALGSLGSKLVLFLLLPLYTHVLTKEEYGIADLVFTTGQLLIPFVSLAIFNGLLRYGLQPDRRNEDVWRCATLVLFVGSIVTILITPLFDFYKPIAPWKWYLCAFVILWFAQNNALVYLKTKDKNLLYALLCIFQAVALMISNYLMLAVFKLGIRGYLLSTILTFAVTTFAAVWFGKMYSDLRNSLYDKLLMREMLIYSLPFVVNDVSWWLIHSTNKIVIETILGSAMLGIFTAASKMPALINTVAGIFNQAWGLSSVREYDTSNDVSFYSKVFNYFNIMIFGACICITAIIKIFMRFYVGAEFFEAWHYVPLLLFSASFAAITGFIGSLLAALKNSKNIMYSTVYGCIVNVVLNIVFIRVFGIWGAVMGSVGAYLTVTASRMICVKKALNIDYNFKKFISLAGVAFIQSLLVGIDFHSLWTTVISLAFFVLIVQKDLLPIYKMFRNIAINKIKRG